MRRFGLSLLWLGAALAPPTGCAAVLGMDELPGPDGSDASLDGALDAQSDGADTSVAPDAPDTLDTEGDDATTPDSSIDDTADTADTADSRATDTGAVDANDTGGADTKPPGDSGCGPLNTVSNCSACGVACDTTNSNGRVCDGTSCQYSGCKAGWADCTSAAPDQDGCETPTSTLTNCGGCGNVCDSTNSNGRSCDGASCNYTGCKANFADCNKAAPNADGCETNIKTSALNCTACGVKCDVLHSVGPTCDGTTCNYNSCFSGYSDCDKTAPNANGCECPTPTCCGSSCAVSHKNCAVGTCGPLGQTYFIADACQVLGTPGNASTYSLAMATAARAAWPVAGTDGSGTCGGGANALSRSSAAGCTVWLYDTTLAGALYVNTTPSDGGPPACLCPGSLTNTWN